MLLLIEASRCLTPTLLLSATVLSLVAWSAEAYAFHLILHWMGFEVSLSFAFSVYALAMLAGGLSFTGRFGKCGSGDGRAAFVVRHAGGPGGRGDDDYSIGHIMVCGCTRWSGFGFGGRTLKGEVVYAKV